MGMPPMQPIPPVDEKAAIAQVAGAVRELSQALNRIHAELGAIRRAIDSLALRPPSP